MATTGAVIARIISQYSDKGSKAAQKDIKKLGQNIDAFSKRAIRSFGLASAAAVGLAVKLGKDAVQGAMEDQKQQAALAMALRNTTGATQDAIAANAAFLDSLELQVAIDNNELIPALQKLAMSTGNLAAAQDLLQLSTDLAAASGKDLQTVATALTRAISGNYGPLGKLGFRLDENAVKAKDFKAVLEELRDISKGQAAAAANTFAGRLITLRLRFNQILDTLGYALIPVLEKFVQRIDNDVIPAIQRWVNANQRDIVKSMETLIGLTEGFMKAVIKLGTVIQDFEPVLKIFGTALLSIIGYLKITGALIAFRTQLGLVIGFFKFATKEAKLFGMANVVAAREVTNFTKALQLLSKVNVGLSSLFGIGAGKAGIMSALRGLGWIGVAIGVVYAGYKGLDWLLDKSAKADVKRKAQQEAAMKKYTDATVQGYDQISLAVTRTKNAEENRQRILDGFKSIEKATAAANKAANDAAKDAAYWAQQDKERLADEAKKLRIKQLEAGIAKKIAVFNRNLLTDQKKQAAQLAAIKKKNAEIDKKYGIKLTDPDEMNAIQMEAIYQNLVKGGKYLLAERTKQQQILDDLQRKAAEEYNKLLERQQDILKALSGDNKVTIQEVGLLAKQWGLSAEAAQFYVDSVLGVQDAKVSATDIQFLTAAWGMSKKQAEQYRDFMDAVNAGHGTISEEKIKELAKKWYGDGESAYNSAKKYEQAIVALQDQEISAEEIKALAEAWQDSEDAVAAYLLSVGVPFTITENAKVLLSSSMIDAIAASWDKARLALEKYLAAARGGIPGGTPGGFTPGSGNDPAVIAAAEEAANAAAAAAADAAAVAAEAEAAAAAAAASAAAVSQSFLNNIREATTNEALNTAVQVAQVVGESASDIANAMMVGLLGQGVDAASAASSARYTGQAIAAMQAAEAKAKADAEAAARALSSGQVRARDAELFGDYSTPTIDYDERFRFMSPTASAGSSMGGGNLMAGGSVNVTVNVAGSVTAEQDLVQTIRQGLLYGQGNGDGITLQAI